VCPAVVVADSLDCCHDTCDLHDIFYLSMASSVLHYTACDLQSHCAACSDTSPTEFATTSAQKDLFHSYGVHLMSLNLYTNMNMLSAACSRTKIFLTKGL
jgi:hypothetical protein